MRNLITTIALLALLGSPGAIAQTTGSARSSAELASSTARSSMPPDRRLIGSAPIGHRQPRPSDVPSENSCREYRWQKFLLPHQLEGVD